MLQDREKLYQAYHAILSMSLTWALALTMNQYFELRVPVYLSAILSFGPAILIYLFNLNKKNIISYLLAGCILPILALAFWLNKLNPIDWFMDYLRWFRVYNGSKELYMARHSNFTLFAVSVLGAVLFYLLMKKQIAKIILAITILTAMITLSISKIGISKAAVGIGIFYIITVLVELFGILYNRKAGRHEKKEGILYLAPVFLMLAILSVGLPSKSEPIQWTFLKNIYYSAKDQIEIWRTELDYYFGNTSYEFAVNQSGYSDGSGNLGSGGRVVKNNSVALKMTGLEKDKSVYLIGSVSDIYTGSSWEKSKKDYLPDEKEYLLDFSELFYALNRQNRGVLENNRFISRKVVRIEYNNIKTKTFFYPLKTSWYDIFSNYRRVSDESARLTFGKGRGKGTSYQTLYYEMNLEGEAFQQMLREADSFTYENAPEINQEKEDWIIDHLLSGANYKDLTVKENLTELLAERSEMIHQQYTSLPEELPDRVKELAAEITADYDTSYDKLKAIEEYLLQYEYTLHPGKTPENEDFTDYFLFESKEGYCTSFATAMAVLGRCIGIPTRYVEGFVATFSEKDKDGMYLIKNNQAHAWAEAYIEGVGWIPFEATAAYHDTRYTKWADLQDAKYHDYASPYEPYMGQVSESGQMGENSLHNDKKDGPNGIIVGSIIVILMAAVIILLFISYDLILSYRYRKQFENSDNSRKMYLLFLRILTLLKREGFILTDQETILMLSGRVKDRLRYGRITFASVADIFMRYRYAEAEVTKEELEQVEAFHKFLSDKKKDEVSRLRVWLDEFIFLAKKNNR
jgi:transglutaminase-like putative cysteine protease